jgi:hypothetical protein
MEKKTARTSFIINIEQSSRKNSKNTDLRKKKQQPIFVINATRTQIEERKNNNLELMKNP